MQTGAGGYIGATAFGGVVGLARALRGTWKVPNATVENHPLTKENIAPAELETTEIAAWPCGDGPLARPTGRSPVTTRSLLFADVGTRRADTGALVETNLAARISLSDVFEIGLVFGRIG